MASIFLSYSSKDKFFARELAERLKANGVKVWLDEVELRVGDSLTKRIGEGIQESDFLGVILSRNSINAEWVEKEVQVGLQRELREKRVVVLPLLLEHVELPPFLRDKVYADFTDPAKYDEALPRILKALGVPHDKVPTVPEPKTEAAPARRLSDAERRLANFEDIRILDFDLAKTYNPDETHFLLNMYLRLSTTPPPEWREIFDAERRFPRHTMWRRAWTEGDYIVVYCVPEELERYHLRDLREDVANANAKYREYLTELAQKETKEATKQEKQKQELSDLRRRLGFD
jgi:hypothetical protein